MSPSDFDRRRWSRRRWVWWTLIGVIGLAGLSWAWVRARSTGRRDVVPVFIVQRGPLRISLFESGSIQSRERVIIRSEVEGRRTILFLVDEGKYVKKGDLLVELDSSGLEESRVEQQIRVANAEAQWIQSRENLLIVSNAAQASVEDAELALRFARLEKEKFEKAEYAMQLQQAEADISIALEELRRAEEKLEWSRRLMDQGYLTRTEYEADELAAKRARLTLELSQAKLNILTNYTYGQTLERLTREIAKADMTLARAKLKAVADLTQAAAMAAAAEAEYRRQKDKLDRIDEQITKCKIYAPSDGMVVYATTVSERRWMQEPLRTGQEVVERQELIYLPATQEMMAVVQLPEANLSKLREGLPARIFVSALPGRVFTGHVARISILPNASQSWLNPDLKVYDCHVWIDSPTEGLRPGMSCRVEILIREYEDVVYVPLQCVLRVAGRPTAYVLEHGEVRPREVEIGLDNNRMVHVVRGLKAGEAVLLVPPLPPSDVEGVGTGMTERVSFVAAMTNGLSASMQTGERRDGPSRGREGRPRPEGRTSPLWGAAPTGANHGSAKPWPR